MLVVRGEGGNRCFSEQSKSIDAEAGGDGKEGHSAFAFWSEPGA